MVKVKIWNEIKSILFILLGVFLAFIGLQCFLLPNGFLDGGITGISLLMSRLFHIEVGTLIFCLNIPFIYLGYKQFSKTFALKTFLAITLFSISLHEFSLPSVTSDKLLIAIFGGVFLGSGIGLCMRGGAVIDGTEVLAVFISRNSSLKMSDFITLFNVMVFGASAFFINLESAMVSMLTYFAAAKVIDFVVTGIEEYIGITIISKKSEEIQARIIHSLGRAVTLYKGEGGYGSRGLSTEVDQKIIFSIVTRLEVQKIISNIEEIDPTAFIYQQVIHDIKGGMIKRRALH